MRSKRRYEIWTGVKGDDKHGGIYLYKYEADENKLLLVRPGGAITWVYPYCHEQ